MQQVQLCLFISVCSGYFAGPLKSHIFINCFKIQHCANLPFVCSCTLLKHAHSSIDTFFAIYYFVCCTMNYSSTITNMEGYFVVLPYS